MLLVAQRQGKGSAKGNENAAESSGKAALQTTISRGRPTMTTSKQSRRRPRPEAQPPAPPNISLGYDPAGEMESIDIASAKEGWSEYTLKDGSVIRAKAVILDVKRAVGQHAPDGNPIYVMQFAIVNQLKVPDKLKKRRP